MHWVRIPAVSFRQNMILT